MYLYLLAINHPHLPEIYVFAQILEGISFQIVNYLFQTVAFYNGWRKKQKMRFIFIYYDKPETLPLKAYLVKKSFHYFMTFYNSNVDFKTLLSFSTLTAFWRMSRWWIIICKHCRSLCFICIFNFNFICLCYYSYKMFCFYLKFKKKQGLCSDACLGLKNLILMF